MTKKRLSSLTTLALILAIPACYIILFNWAIP